MCVGVLWSFGITEFRSATPSVYTNEADWLAAIGRATVQTEDFESSPLGLLPPGYTDIGLFEIYHNAPGPLPIQSTQYGILVQ